MKYKIFFKSIVYIILLLLVGFKIQAQQSNCVFKDPVFKIDFGTSGNIPGVNIFPLPNYRAVESTCPEDGDYSFVSKTSGCFNDDWHTFNEDHTPGDKDGRMMLVNASPEGGVFFNTIINGLNGNTTYQLTSSLVNVCRISGGCAPLPPDIIMKLQTPASQTIISFHTGLLSQNAVAQWKVYSGMFTTPANTTTIILTMEDITQGGCGNDFALDDITLRECVKPVALVKPIVKQPVQPKGAVKKTPASHAEVKTTPAKPTPVKHFPVKDTLLSAVKRPVIDTPQISKPIIREKPSLMPLPKSIATRSNPLIKQIETEAGEIEIDLYDNGEIDGDTVSVYHNNELIVSRAGLSARPVSFSIKIDPKHPRHELIMVANNLGSIPPNTSLMLIKANNKRYEVFISTSEQKNAKIEIDLKDKN